MKRLGGLILLFALIVPVTAQARPFQPLPPRGATRTALQIRVMRYTGGVFGKMIVEVRNAGANEETFSAEGLYFVPEIAPERAPQREGAAGPFEVAGMSGRQRTSATVLRSGATVRAELSTFCLDSHRSSPRAGQAYRVASRRLPPALQAQIETGTAQILMESRPEAAGGAIQNLVWRARNQSWVQLEGERPGERSEAQPPASQPASEGGLINL